MEKQTMSEEEIKIQREYESIPCILCTDGYACIHCGREMELVGSLYVCHECKIYATTIG